MNDAVLVTGGTGFIGRAVLQRLAAGPARRVVCLTRSNEAPAIEGTTFVQWDASVDRLPALPDGITFSSAIHLASPGVRLDDRSADTMLRGTVDYTARLIEALAERAKGRMVFAGSCAQYGSVDSQQDLTEDHVCWPSSLYGATKHATETLGAALCREAGLGFTSLRIFGVYGPHEPAARLLPTVLARARAGERVPLTGGAQVRDFTFVADVADAIVRAAEQPVNGAPAVYNVCSGVGRSVREVVEEAAEQLACPPELFGWGDLEYRPDEPMRLVGDNAKFRAATGWSPTTSLTDGIARFVRWVEGERAR